MISNRTSSNQSASLPLSQEPSEPLLSFLEQQSEMVFLEKDGQKKLNSLLSTAQSHFPDEKISAELINALITVTPVVDNTNATQFKFLPGRHHLENQSVRGVFRHEPEFSKESHPNRIARLVGQLFKIIERSNPGQFTWAQTLDVINCNCHINSVSPETRLSTLTLTPAASARIVQYDAQAVRQSVRVLELLGGDEAPEFLKALYHRFTPQFVERKVGKSDRPIHATIDPDSSILREDVVTGMSVQQSDTGTINIHSRIYLSNKAYSQVRDGLSHELLEIGIMHYMLNTPAVLKLPTPFIVQYLAETHVSDLLVWCLQHKLLSDFIEPQPLFSNRDRTLVLLLSGALKKFPAANLLGASHPLTLELATYQRSSEIAGSTFSQAEVKCISRNMEKNVSSQDREKYNILLGGFLNRFFGEITKLSRRNPKLPLLLNNPDLLLQR